MNAKGSAAHIHMAGTMQTVIYAPHHRPDSAFNPDLEKTSTLCCYSSRFAPSPLPLHRGLPGLRAHFGAASPIPRPSQNAIPASVHNRQNNLFTARTEENEHELEETRVSQVLLRSSCPFTTKTASGRKGQDGSSPRGGTGPPCPAVLFPWRFDHLSTSYRLGENTEESG